MADGRVATGFSFPWVALYGESGGTVTYTSAQALARGVDVDLSVETSSDNNFYANNQIAESVSGTFASGTVTLTVDGLKDAAKKLILGLPAADTEGWTAYGDDQSIPYVGVGFIVRYMEEGVTSYVPIVLSKVLFSTPSLTAATQEAEIDWQTQELEGTIFRADDANHNWKYEGTGEATEAAALAKLKAKLGVA